MGEMTKGEFRQYILSAEKEELKRMTPQEAFEAGKRGDPTQYDLAGRKVALALLRFFERHPEIELELTYCLGFTPADVKKAKARGGVMTQINEVLDEQAKKEIDAIGPTRAMFGWALESIKWLLEKVKE